MRRWASFWSFWFGLVLIAGCGTETPSGLPIPLAGPIVIREGLPRAVDEITKMPVPVVVDAARATIDIEGYTLYEAPLVVAEADRSAIVALLNTSATYWDSSEPKKCGGFHPDYAVEWTAKGQTWRLLICFGCAEAEQVGPDGINRYDLNPRNRVRLRTLLDGLRANQPRPGQGK